MTTSEVYWLTRLDGIHDFLTTVCAVLLVGTIAVALIMYLNSDGYGVSKEEEKTRRATAAKTAKCGVLFVFVTGLLSVFVPTTKELIAIYGISYLTQNKDAREIPAEALKVLNQKLKDMEAE